MRIESAVEIVEAGEPVTYCDLFGRVSAGNRAYVGDRLWNLDDLAVLLLEYDLGRTRAEGIIDADGLCLPPQSG